MVNEAAQRGETREPHGVFRATHRRRHQRALEAELGRLLEPEGGMGDGTELARQRHLPKRDRLGGTGRSASAETSAAATARSAAGSVMR